MMNLLHYVNYPAFILDEDMLVIDCNDAFYRLNMPASNNKGIPQKLSFFFKQNNVKDFCKIFNNTFINGDVLLSDITIYNSTGNSQIYISESSPYEGHSGKTKKILCVLKSKDQITSQNFGDSPFHVTREIFNDFFNNCPINFFIKDSHGNYLYVSKNFNAVTGAGQKKVTGNNTSEIWEPGIATQLSEEDNTVVNTGKLLEVEGLVNGHYYMRCKFPLQKGNGETLVGGYFIDISQLKKTENELMRAHQTARQNEEKFKLLAEYANDYIIHLSTDGKILYINNYAAKSIGFSPTDLDGENISKVVGPNDLGRMLNNLKTIAESGKGIVTESHYNFKGHEVWLEARMEPVVNKEGKVISIHTLSRDITERKNAIKALEKSEQTLEKLNKNLEARVRREIRKFQQQQSKLIQKSKLESLGEMAASISHEINGPLGIILISLESLRATYRLGKADAEFIEHKLDTIMRSIHKIRSITEHMRIFSRDQKIGIIEDFDMNTLVEETLSIIQSQYRNHKVELVVELGSKLPLVQGKKVHMEQVLLNLLSNARHAVEEKAIYYSSADYRKTIRIYTRLEREGVSLEVNDNGIGIPKKHLKHLFDPFFTTKNEDEGTGLGLSICYGLMKEMKGNIVFESNPSEYTLAKAWLPCNKRTKLNRPKAMIYE